MTGKLLLVFAALLAADQGGERMVQLDVYVMGPGRVLMPGGRICGPDTRCSEPVRERTRMRFRALQEPGVDGRFAGWDGACRGVAGLECGGRLRVNTQVIARFER